MDDDKCQYCRDGFITIKTAGLPELLEPCLLCHPDEATMTVKKTQKRVDKDAKL